MVARWREGEDCVRRWIMRVISFAGLGGHLLIGRKKLGRKGLYVDFPSGAVVVVVFWGLAREDLMWEGWWVAFRGSRRWLWSCERVRVKVR